MFDAGQSALAQARLPLVGDCDATSAPAGDQLLNRLALPANWAANRAFSALGTLPAPQPLSETL